MTRNNARKKLVKPCPKEWLLDDETIANGRQESKELAEDQRKVQKRATLAKQAKPNSINMRKVLGIA